MLGRLFTIIADAPAGATQPAASDHAAAAASRASVRADALMRQIKLLEDSLAKSLLISETLWEIIKEKHKLSDEELYKKLTEVDLRDGSLDGKNQRPAVPCPDCGHTVSKRHLTCLYCGKVMDTSIFNP